MGTVRERWSEQSASQVKGLISLLAAAADKRATATGRNTLREPHRGEDMVYLCPEAVAIGEGPLGARGSSHVLISIMTLSRV